MRYSTSFSARMGWIPMDDDVPEDCVEKFRWMYGLTVTEMEIVHGAYRTDNPNCEDKVIEYQA